MKKLITWLIILSVIASFAAIKKKNLMAKHLLIGGVKSMLNLRLSIEDVDVSLKKHALSVKNLKVYNPAGFENEPMILLGRIYIDYDLYKVIRKKVHFNILKVDLEELLIIRNAEGNLNFMKIKGMQKPRTTTASAPDFKIDKLYLSVGRVVFRDYFRRSIPVNTVYNINLHNQLFENITDPKSLISSIIYKAIIKTDIIQLLNFNVNILKQNLRDVIDKGGAMIKELKADIAGSANTQSNDLKQTIKKLFITGEK